MRSSPRCAAPRPAASSWRASAAEALDLLAPQAPRRPGCEVAELERAEGDAAQLDDRVADRLEHAADLPLAALVDDDLQLGAEALDARRRGRAVVELDAVAQAPEVILGRASADAGAVGLGNLEARMGQAVRELAVVGQQDQAGALGIQAPDRVQAPGALGRELDDGRAPVGVARGRDHAGRLVDRVDDVLARRAQRRAVERDAARLVDVARRIGDGLAGDRDPARAHDVLGGAAGGDAGVSEVLREPHTLIQAWTSSCSAGRWTSSASRASAQSRSGRGPPGARAATTR